MKALLQIALCAVLAAPLLAQETPPACEATQQEQESAGAYGELMNAQPKLIRISAVVDGSGRIVFTRHSVRYEHRHWRPPINVTFAGEPWTDLSRAPAAWIEIADDLDLTKAWVVKRRGRDTIALEQTPDGFDLYLCDSPNGSAQYEVIIAIPRRP